MGVQFYPAYAAGMSKTPVRKFSSLDHDIEIIRERRNLPDASRMGIEVRYGLKFDGQLTDWSEFVEATNDEAAANRMAELGLQRARALRKQDRAAVVSPAA
ncbi:hypothetical protein QR90_06690 [Deinococcus radiopugnans]|uniref:Uncharacterized protein n=2 Tax=Deinococcus radiopugnans TaxID=57497 RepID=A0A0A7KFD4_9DEIO|nr:hypothetical protein QR90_06690 [Deinococcus radiopugnans]